jgi:predicted molibdopterin-dependent oxidoreductase YjgC
VNRGRPRADDRRLEPHGDVERGEPVIVWVDDRERTAFLGETVAALLMASGARVFRETHRSGSGRGFYCGMGVCYDCLVVIDGRPNVRACMTYVRAGMRIETQRGWGLPAGAQRP